MILGRVITIFVIAAFIGATQAQARARPVQVRIAWLQERVGQHQWICRHGRHATKSFHCRALVWSRRELREARAEQYARDYDWQAWLPDKWARVGACETGYGKRPGNWQWDSGVYVSAFGIIRPAYDSTARALGLPAWDGHRPLREQWRVADAIQRRYGFGAWGCGGA